MSAWYCLPAMSKKHSSRTTTRKVSRTAFTCYTQLLHVSCLGLGVLVGCTSGVESDGTKTQDAGIDAGNEPGSTHIADASAPGTTSSDDAAASTKPNTSTRTNPSTTGSAQTSATDEGATSANTDSNSDATSGDASSAVSEPTSTDADTSDTDTSDTSEPSSEGHDIFVVLGHGQRTIVSCDDGKTWTNNRFTEDLPLSGIDLDHQPFNMRAATYDRGTFYAAWGWGSPIYVERSVDGVNWEGVLSTPGDRNGISGWSMIAGDGKVLVGENTMYALSDDAGDTWQTFSSGLNSAKPVFGYGDGVFVAVTEGGNNRDYEGYPLFLRSTDGLTWSTDVDYPEDCLGGRATKIAYGNDTFVVAVDDHICSSKDGGQSWQRSPSPGGAMFQAIFDGSRFVAMNRSNVLYESTDGLEWSRVGSFQSSMGYNFGIGVSTATGTLVAVRDNQFFRSDDGGVSFEQLDTGAYVDEGGPLVQVEFGRVASSPACE